MFNELIQELKDLQDSIEVKVDEANDAIEEIERYRSDLDNFANPLSEAITLLEDNNIDDIQDKLNLSMSDVVDN